MQQALTCCEADAKGKHDHMHDMEGLHEHQLCTT